MLSRLVRSGWALVAAGALGVVAPAAAQTAAPAAQTVACQSTDSAARQADAQRVELAWLGHPATFPHALTAVPTGGGVEVRGFVPSEAVREQAVALARLMTDAPVHDRLTVHTGLAAKATGGALADVQRDAIAALRDAFGDRVDGVEVAARAGGQVTLRGKVDSLECKLMASRQMRQVRGCTCVANQLEVPPPVRAAAPAPAAVRAVAWQPAEPTPESAAPKPAAPAPASGISSSSPATIPLAPVPAAPAPQPVTPPTQKQEAPPPAPVPEAALQGSPVGRYVGSSPYGRVQAPQKGAGSVSPYGPHAATTPVPRAVPRVPASQVIPAANVPLASAPKVVPAVGAEVEAAKPAEPKQTAISPTVAREGYESSGFLLLVDNDVAPPVMRADQPIVPATLETMIRNLCGENIKDVKVTPQPNQSITVSVCLARAEAEQTVVPLLLQLPEMSHLNVRLEVTVP